MSAAEALAPERSVDEVRESLSVTEKGQPANTIGNCRTVFCHDPLLRGAIRLNLLTDRVDIVQDLGWRRNTSALTDTDVKYLLLYFEQTYGLTSEKKMTAALSIVANENCYHPIQDVLNGLVWDGTPRIRSCLHHFLGADESDYVEEMLKHFLLGAIRRVFRPGSKYEEMLCLVGGQGAGKSSFFRLLAIRDEWFSDDLKKLDDDRVYLKLQGHWIIEMSEMLATSSAKSIEEIRSFISRQKETYRTPYEAQPKDRLRQCVFGGSSNTLDFLPLDRAGNRRFLPIMIYPENAEVHILEDEDVTMMKDGWFFICVLFFTFSMTEIPSSLGMITSMRTISGFVRTIMLYASSPLSAFPTTWIPSSFSRISPSKFKVCLLSSAIAMDNSAIMLLL